MIFALQMRCANVVFHIVRNLEEGYFEINAQIKFDRSSQ